jgi:mannosyltransferase OCH1-like enzyme
MNDVIQGLWIGSELSIMEQLSIASFLQNGHDYHLYVYDEVKNVPAGTVIRDANEILPASRIFQYKHQASYAGFANFFRYKLLLERGGWWIDTDVICVKAFDFSDEYVFAGEIDKDSDVVASGIIKTPAGSSVMAYAWKVCEKKDPRQLMWGETGPKLMTEAVKKFSLEYYRKPYWFFCPLGFREWRRVLELDGERLVHEDTYAIHLWNEMWRVSGQDKNATYEKGCLYEQLKMKYLSRAR